MNKQTSVIQKIDRKWVKESKRTFLEFPGMPRSGVLGEEETWLELTQFYRDDLKWLLSLEHHKFWSHMIYSEKAHQTLVSFLKGSPPNCLKKSFLDRDDMRNIYKEIEHLVFLAFLRLSTERESESCYIRSFRDIIYNNYLFTVPIILDICLIYGTSNKELVKRMINNIITSAPDFLDDFQEVIPHFIHVLKTLKDKCSVKNADLQSNSVEDLVLYLCDTVATIQVFFELYPNACQLFSKSEVINEIIQFYSNILPQVLKHWSEKCLPINKNSLVGEHIENVRIDLLKIVKNILDFVLNEFEEIPEQKDVTVNEYLNLVIKLQEEPVFFCDYNLMYSVEFELECAIKNSGNVDFMKVNQILKVFASVGNKNNCKGNTNEEIDVSEVKFDSLVTEIKDILPYLGDDYIKECLNYYNNDTEKVIAAVLENVTPPDFNVIKEKTNKTEEILEFKGKHKNKHKNLNEMLNDREEILKVKERYAELSFVVDEAYDDEYDDTYDENIDFSLREADDTWRRPFVVPRVLQEAEDEGDEEYEEYGDDGKEEEETENNTGRDHFVENPAVWRERMEQKRQMRQNVRDVAGRGRGQGQSKQVLRNREFKESHKSTVANHNRKKQAGRKMARGMIPLWQ